MKLLHILPVLFILTINFLVVSGDDLFQYGNRPPAKFARKLFDLDQNIVGAAIDGDRKTLLTFFDEKFVFDACGTRFDRDQWVDILLTGHTFSHEIDFHCVEYIGGIEVYIETKDPETRSRYYRSRYVNEDGDQIMIAGAYAPRNDTPCLF